MDKISGFQYVKSQNVSNAVCLKIDGNLVDLSASIDHAKSPIIITLNDKEGLEVMRHTTSHIMAQAIKELYPTAKFAIGPVIENGFYYDILLDKPLTPDDIIPIEAKMLEIIKRDEKIIRSEISKEEAISLFSSMQEYFKVELIQELDCKNVTIYTQGKFVDLCRGPHMPSTKVSKHFKIMKFAGAYWRGDSKNVMLQRIYATTWDTKENLDAYLQNLQEVEKRDHRKIGKAMDLFHLQEEAAGSVFWHPKGWTLFKTLREFIFNCISKDGYLEVSTPQMIDRVLWEMSGHWEKFHANMFIAESENRTLAIKPMNCPGHVQIFKQHLRSYKELPFRVAEFGVCHRNEPSGSLYGLMRVRAFTCDDGHIFCTKEQINLETQKFCNLLKKVYKILGFESFHVRFSDRPDLRAGSDEIWDIAENLLQIAASAAGLECILNKGEGAFYGPKLEFVLLDKLGREWQCGTLQCDFVLPERLDIHYIGEDGQKHRPIMLHRAILGSLERFIGILLENYAGKLPLWLSPEQVTVINVTNDFDGYATKVHELMMENGVKSVLDIRAEKVSYKIRELTLKKMPIIIVVGQKEEMEQKVTMRYLDGTQVEMKLDDSVEQLQAACAVPIV